MATSLAAQLAQVAAKSKATLNVKAQKAAHSKSLIWEPRVAASQSYQGLFATCFQGFEELCQLDERFTQFQDTLFSEESQTQDRTQLSKAESAELDKQIDAFLRLAGSRLRLMPTIKAIEWLIRRFRIHEDNTSALLLTFLPYHSIPAFATLLSILPARVPHEFRFLDPYIRSWTSPPRTVLVHQSVHHPEFLSLVSEYTLESCRMQYQYPALVTFWGCLMTESLNGILDRTKSGRASVQADNDQALLHRVGPILAESLVMKKVPSVQIASYMIIAVFSAKANLHDTAVTAFMEQTVHGWTNETVKAGLVCLAILAQYRSAKQMSGKVTKALMKVSDVGSILVEIGQERRVDKLANGLCLALIERFTKKSDSRGLPTIMAILSSRLLQAKQVEVIFKSLLLSAHRLNDENDEDGALRRDLGSALISATQIEGETGEIIQTAIKEVEFDIEELEMKLDLSFRTRALPESAQEDTAMANGSSVPTQPRDFETAIQELSERKEGLSPCLLPQPKEIFDEFCQLFLSLVSDKLPNSEFLAKFERCPQLQRSTAPKNPTYCSFFVRIWCGPYPALARAAAIEMVKDRLKTEDRGKKDIQVLIPYCISALSDPSKRVRQAAADLMAVIASLYTLPISAKDVTVWGVNSFYGKSKELKVLSPDIMVKMLQYLLLPSIEECVMDPDNISQIIKAAIEHGKYQGKVDASVDKKDHMSQAGRQAFMSYLADHIIHTPIVVVKARLLTCLNGARGVSSMTRTQVLLPVVQWWSELEEEKARRLCAAEKVDKALMDERISETLVPNDGAGLDFVLTFLKSASSESKAGLTQALFARMKKMWASLKDDMKFTVAEQLLDIAQDPKNTSGANSVAASEAADLLRTVPLTTSILSFFLDSIHTGTKMITEPPPNKRRRTSSNEGNRGLVTQVTPELSQALRKVIFVLQLVDSSEPVSHPELLDGLFTALSELQHFRTVVGSELGYLQNLILRSLLAMMPAFKADKQLVIDSSGGYGDLLVNCIQKSSSPVVQNAALLLIADLATIAPDLVLHSVMPIFTFMGTSVLRQSDDYSAHVVAQTIKEVVPPLIESLRRGKKSPVAGASDILVSFTTAYEHIPSHRRQDLFIALVETLGPRDFLFALISMLVHRYGASEALLLFINGLLNHFKVEVQLETLVKLLDLVADLFKPKPGISFVLLGISEGSEAVDVEQIALRLLTAFPTFLSSKKLSAHISKVVGRDDMEASEVREMYAKLLEGVLLLADTVKSNKALHSRCGSALANLLGLLSIGEFIKAVENLLDRPNMGLRQKVLKALEVRVDKESNADADSRAVLLSFLPQLTAAIRDSADIRYKHTAVTCVDKIAEKYGKKDIEAVVAAAMTIAGEHCLGQDDGRLRIMALLCLTSLTDVLQDAIVPVLPVAIPQAIQYLRASIDGDDSDEELHSASFGFIGALAEHLPYMISNHLDRIFEVSNLSAEAELQGEANDARSNCLHLLARQIDSKDLFTSLDRNWSHAMSVGFTAMTEYLNILGIAIDRSSKSAISKNASTLTAILTKVFDMRRSKAAEDEDDEDDGDEADVAMIEADMNEKMLKMVFKLNDASFRPIFVQLVEWSTSSLPKQDTSGRILRAYSTYGFFLAFFGSLKSIVTNYATYIVEDAAKWLGRIDVASRDGQKLWTRILQTLRQCFEHDQDDFWQAPAHFGAVKPVLLDQFTRASSVDVEAALIPAVVELAAAADSQTHQKELNSVLLHHLKSDQAAVRLAAVKCQQAMTDRLGEEWLSMLHEMLPRISELQEDDDETVERETHRWIVKIEGVLGESLDAMLQ